MSSQSAPLQVDLLESSFALVQPRAGEFAERFYTRLFEVAPQTRAMFPQDMEGQKRALVGSLVIIVRALRSAERLGLYLEGLGRRHTDYGATPSHYDVVGSVLLETLAGMAGDAWTPELARAWSDGFAAVSAMMLEAQSDGVAA